MLQEKEGRQVLQDYHQEEIEIADFDCLHQLQFMHASSLEIKDDHVDL